MGLFDASTVATTFVLILPSELPDKTFVAALVLDEFVDARDVVTGLSAEYAACESPDYLQRSGQFY